VLVISDGYIKLADFGLSKRLTERTTTMCGTLQYLAPEIILSKAYGKPIDWWALGVVMFEIVVGRTPFKNKNTNKMFKNILGVKYKAPNTISSDLADIIRNLLQLDVSKRFGNLKNGTNDIKNHR
jgi:protein kinase A